jgi:hypothetical protein
MGYKYQKDAEKLGAMGRNGDSIMMHVNPLEVQALENMRPGSITINPDTGQPEAFFWLIPALLQGVLGTAGTGLAAAGTGIGGAFGTSALGSAVGSTLAAPLTTAASALGTLGGTSGIAGSMGGLSTALGAPQGVAAALGAAPTVAVPAGTTGSLSGTLGVTGATAGKTGLAGAIETGASKLGSLAAGQVTGPTDLLTTGINKGVGAIKGLAGAKAPTAAAKTATKSVVTPPGTPTPAMANDLSTRLANIATPSTDTVNTLLDPVRQGLGVDPASALKPSLAPTKQGIAAATRGVPEGVVDKVTANLGDRAVQGLNAKTVSAAPQSVVKDVTANLGERAVGAVDPGVAKELQALQGQFDPKTLGKAQSFSGQPQVSTGVPDGSIYADTGTRLYGAPGSAKSASVRGLEAAGSPQANVSMSSTPTSAAAGPGKFSQGLGKLGEMGTKGVKWGLEEGLPKVGKFASENPMLVLGGGYMLDQALQDEQEMPGWAKKMQGDGTGPGEIWSDDYAMQVLPTFQGMQSPQEWEEQFYVSQFNPYSNPTYMRMAGGGIVNAPRYAGGGYINPRLRRR